MFHCLPLVGSKNARPRHRVNWFVLGLQRVVLALAACLAVVVASYARPCAAASVLAGWDTSTLPGGSNNFGPSPMAATMSDPNLTVGGLTRGAGVGTTGGSGAQRAWGGNNWLDTSAADAVTNSRFATFTVSAKSGYQVSFQTVTKFDYRRSSTGASNGTLQYQIGSGSFTDITTLNYSGTDSTGDSLPNIDLSGIAALQNVPSGVTVTFRIVNYGGTYLTGTWYIFDKAKTTANDFEIQGTVSPAPTQVRVETAANGSGSLVSAQSFVAGGSITAYAVSRDAGGNFVANTPATWSLLATTGGVVATDLVPATDGRSAVFTPHVGSGIIHASVAGLTSVDSGTITATAPPPTTVSVETAPSGMGVPVPAQMLMVGYPLAVFAVSRDANGVFVANVPANWSLLSVTGGIDASSLVASGDGMSAIFTPISLGTSVIHAAVTGLSSIDSGTITVTVQAPSSVRVETAPDGSGQVVAAQTVMVGNSITVYAISRDSYGYFVANSPATWSLLSVTGGVVSTDLVASGDGTSAVFTAHAGGSAIIHASYGALTSVDSGVVTAQALPTNPVATGPATPPAVAENKTLLLTVTVTPGANPTSTGLTVSGDLTQLGGAPGTAFYDDGSHGDITAGDGTYSFSMAIPSGFTGGTKSIPITVVDAQGRSAATALSATVLGSFTIFHVNDTHARVTPHKWIIPSYDWTTSSFEDVGGAAYLAGAVEHFTTLQPNSLFVDAGDISEGNPIGDMNGNATMTQFYALLSNQLKSQGSRGIDAVVVGNHDVRDISYIQNLDTLHNAGGVPVISVNVRNLPDHSLHFEPHTVVTVNGTKIGIIGYTTSASEVGASLADTLEVADCDWNSGDSTKIHIKGYVDDLRNQGCNVVILLAHVGQTAIATDTTQDGQVAPALLMDDGVTKLPEVAITGHWHTWASTVWQPESLNYKTIFAESASYMKYLGELQVTGEGRYLSSTQHVIRDADYVPDMQVENLVESLKGQYDAAHPDMPVGTLLGYTADDLMLDNRMKWWSADEYPWDGNNSAGQWICDAMQWKSQALFGQCDLAMETGGGVRADIPAGPVTFLQVYETFPWSDDTFYRVNMTGQDLYNFIKVTGCDAGFSSALDVTAHDGIPTLIKFKTADNGWQPVDLARTYTVAINSYMYQHPPNNWTWTDTNPLTDPTLCRDGIVQYMQTWSQSNPYHVGGPRYHLDTEFSGGYRAVVTMMNDNDTKPSYEDAFIRLVNATPDTLIRLGSPQVPTNLVNPDGSINPNNHLAEIELYRSYLGFKTGALKPGDIIETWGKGSFYRGDPEFVDQEGIYGDGVEFNIVGHDDSLAKPAFVRSANALFDDNYKNHYVKFLARKTVASPPTAVDQYGTSVTIWDATAYAAKTGVPGNTGDLLLLTGVPTMENYGIRFRCATAELASTYGITDFPAASDVTSTVASVPALTTNGQITLSANASAVTPSSVLTPVADAQVESGANYVNSNYGTTKNLYVQSSSTSSYGNERAWVKFDLSTVPNNATITKATLSLYNWKAAGAALPTELHGGSDDSWTETGLTWNNQPALSDVIATQTLAAGTYNVWYSWDVTSFVQSKLASNKLASFVLKAQAENSSDSTPPSYAFDSKEYGSGTAPTLQITTASTGATIASVDYYYRYSSDNKNWGAWTATTPATNSPYAEQFNLPMGQGYYEFYSTATDGQGATESAPPMAEASTHYVQPAPGSPEAAIVQLSNLSQTYSGSPLPATVTTTPPSLAMNVTYNGSTSVPVEVGSYNVQVSITQPGYTGSGSGTLYITKGTQSITWPDLQAVKVGVQPFALAAAASSGLPITYTSSNPAVATVSGAIVTVVGAGTTTIMAIQGGNTDYLAATAVSHDLIVNAAAPAVPTLPLPALLALMLGLMATALLIFARRRATG